MAQESGHSCAVEDGRVQEAVRITCAPGTTFVQSPPSLNKANSQIHNMTSHHDTVPAIVLDLRPQEPVSSLWYCCRLKEMDSK